MKHLSIDRTILLALLLVGLPVLGGGCRPSGEATETSGDSASHVASGQEAAKKWVGKAAAGFILPDPAGKEVDVSQEIGKRPIVLVFYRGVW